MTKTLTFHSEVSSLLVCLSRYTWIQHIWCVLLRCELFLYLSQLNSVASSRSWLCMLLHDPRQRPHVAVQSSPALLHAPGAGHTAALALAGDYMQQLFGCRGLQGRRWQKLTIVEVPSPFRGI